MSASSALPFPEPSKSVDELIDDWHQTAIKRSGFILADEARAIAAACDPQVLLEYVMDTAVTIISQKMRRLLAEDRQRQRIGVFSSEQEALALIQSPFDVKFACEGDVWRNLGHMTKPDFEYLIDAERGNARESLFKIGLARSIIKLLPDDQTPVSKVLTANALTKLEAQILTRADKAVTSFK